MGHPPSNANEMFASLKDNNLIAQDEVLETAEKGDYYERLLCFYSQVRGAYYFTDRSVVFVGGFAGTTNWAVRYADIRRIKKCSVGPFLPFGVKIFYYDENKDKERSYKLSLLNRDKWIKFLEDKTK